MPKMKMNYGRYSSAHTGGGRRDKAQSLELPEAGPFIPRSNRNTQSSDRRDPRHQLMAKQPQHMAGPPQNMVRPNQYMTKPHQYMANRTPIRAKPSQHRSNGPVTSYSSTGSDSVFSDDIMGVLSPRTRDSSCEDRGPKTADVKAYIERLKAVSSTDKPAKHNSHNNNRKNSCQDNHFNNKTRTEKPQELDDFARRLRALSAESLSRGQKDKRKSDRETIRESHNSNRENTRKRDIDPYSYTGKRDIDPQSYTGKRDINFNGHSKTGGSSVLYNGQPNSGGFLSRTNDKTNDSNGFNSTVTRDDEEVSCCAQCVRSPRPWCAVACFMATVTFLGAVNTDLLPKVRTRALGNLLPLEHVYYRPDSLTVIWLIVLWGVHFLRRFSEVLFLHDYRRHFHIWEAVGINLYYPVFGFWIGWSCNYFNDYFTPNKYILVPGIILFITGETGNCFCHVMLRRLRSKQFTVIHSTSGRVLPTGKLFKHVTCPHYIFELVTWIGFALGTFTLAAFLFLGLNTVIIIVYAVLRKRQYRREFDGRDGQLLFESNRKVQLPGRL